MSEPSASGPVVSSPSTSVSCRCGRPGRSRPSPAALPARDGSSEGEGEGGSDDTDGADGSDTAGSVTNDTEEAEAEAECGEAGRGETGVRDGLDGLDCPEGRSGGLDGREECPAAGREAAGREAAGREGPPWSGVDAVPEGAEAVPWVATEVATEAEAVAEAGASAEVEVEGAEDGLDNGPHAEAWPPGRTAAPSPMSSPVARIVATHSHGVTSGPPHGARWMQER